MRSPKMRKRGKRQDTRKGSFDPDDARRVQHTRVGVWDLYEEKFPEQQYVPAASKFEQYWEFGQGLPYVWRMLGDIAKLRDCWVLLGLYLVVETILSLIPAVSLWFSGQLLKIVQVAVDTRTVDKRLLFEVAGGRVACLLMIRILYYFKARLAVPLNLRIKHHYSVHIFHAMARLDVPTSEDSSVQRQLEATWSRSGNSIAWDTVVMTAEIASVAMKLVSQLSVLISVLRDQPEGPLLAVLTLTQSLFEYRNMRVLILGAGIWAATTKNEDYVRMEGLKRVVNDAQHRKEIVAGNMSDYLTTQYREMARRVGDDAGDYYESRRSHQAQKKLTLSSMIQYPLRELPLIAFTLRAVQYPASIPLSLASLNLLQETSRNFSHGLLRFVDQTNAITEQIADVRKLYEVVNIPNQIPDGHEPFPEDEQKLLHGVSVEFRNVSFKYPVTEKYALQNVSFRILAGQLCVIVGSNGSGKSTILKLLARIYDPTDGEILLDGRDIRTLKLADLRRSISVLFQDYTHFPLSIKENIALGHPESADDSDRILEAAKLGGAEEFINQLPEGFNTYLDRPVRDYYSPLPEGTKTLFGRPVDYSYLRGVGGMNVKTSTSLSGGQMQRLAVSRTFMRSLVSESSEPRVGLLLFDEPSASLDPTAEHDLFERLRQLRGQKTMIFSSHRFGNLTRHADLILYMNDSFVKEAGTHDALLKQGGEYARIWQLQAQAFMT